jgi:hypothetical protein
MPAMRALPFADLRHHTYNPANRRLGMTRMDPLFRMVIVALVTLGSSPAALAVNKCVDESGRTAYQDKPCPSDAEQHTLDLRGSEPRAARPTTGDADDAASTTVDTGPGVEDESEDQAILALVSMQTGYELCARASDDFADRHAGTLAAWQRVNAVEIARLEPSPRYRMILANGRRQVEQQAAMMMSARAQLVSFCEVQFMPQMQAVTAASR